MDYRINKFGKLHRAVAEGKVVPKTTKQKIAAVILLDQLSRDIYDGKAEAFAFDDRALALAKELIENKQLSEEPEERQWFALFPLLNSESILDKFTLLGYSHRRLESTKNPIWTRSIRGTEVYLKVLERFNRYPKRNKVLGRPSTSEELDYLQNK